MKSSSTGKKGGKKIGRGLRKPAHSRYVSLNICLRNRIRKLKKHIKKYARDLVAKEALKRAEK